MPTDLNPRSETSAVILPASGAAGASSEQLRAQAGEVLQATEEGVPEEQATIFENTDFNNVYTPNQPTSISLQSANEASSAGQTASTNTSTASDTSKNDANSSKKYKSLDEAFADLEDL